MPLSNTKKHSILKYEKAVLANTFFKLRKCATYKYDKCCSFKYEKLIYILK